LVKVPIVQELVSCSPQSWLLPLLLLLSKQDVEKVVKNVKMFWFLVLQVIGDQRFRLLQKSPLHESLLEIDLVERNFPAQIVVVGSASRSLPVVIPSP
jgi:hypothetical protein